MSQISRGCLGIESGHGSAPRAAEKGAGHGPIAGAHPYPRMSDLDHLRQALLIYEGECGPSHLRAMAYQVVRTAAACCGMPKDALPLTWAKAKIALAAARASELAGVVSAIPTDVLEQAMGAANGGAA